MEEAQNKQTCCQPPKVESTCCCAGGQVARSSDAVPTTAPHWVKGVIDTPAGAVQKVTSKLTSRDTFGAWRVRWTIGRNNYRVIPGIYAVGDPNPTSPVLVAANYKMSFDRLRSQLDCVDAWVLVLDTKGVNVWCSAGKGTFGTDELIKRADEVRLADIVSHRNLVLPQLSATGVSAHEVRERSGWRVTYGPIRSNDLPAFLNAGMKATLEMRRVRFALPDRVVLIPSELVQSAKYLLIAAVCLILLSGLGTDGYSLQRIQDVGIRGVMMLLIAYLCGVAVSPALLPWIPGRAFALKGAWVGLAAAIVFVARGWIGGGIFDNWAEAAGYLLIVPAVSSYLAMNFTGCSTYTSLSGVRLEMRFAVPAQIAAAALGIIIWVTGRFI